MDLDCLNPSNYFDKYYARAVNVESMKLSNKIIFQRQRIYNFGIYLVDFQKQFCANGVQFLTASTLTFDGLLQS